MANDQDTALDYQKETVKTAEWVSAMMTEYAEGKSQDELRRDDYFQKLKRVSDYSQHLGNHLAILANDLPE